MTTLAPPRPEGRASGGHGIGFVYRGNLVVVGLFLFFFFFQCEPGEVSHCVTGRSL